MSNLRHNTPDELRWEIGHQTNKVGYIDVQIKQE